MLNKRFQLPPKDVLTPNNENDPLPYYYKPFTGYLYKQRIERILSLLRHEYESVLEVGYGSGLMLPTLALISKTLSGIDLESDPNKTNANMKKIGIKVALSRGDVKDTGYLDNSFDLVIGISIFEHIREIDLCVKEVFRILKPGGEFLVGMPRIDRAMSRLFSLIGFSGIDDHHVTNYKQFIKEANKKFDLIKFSKMPSFLPSFVGLYFGMLFKKPL